MNKKILVLPILLVALSGMVFAMYGGLVPSAKIFEKGYFSDWQVSSLRNDFGVISSMLGVSGFGNETWCNETDGGKVFDVQGTTFGVNGSSNYSYDDYCETGSGLREYFCVDNQLSHVYQSCKDLGYAGCNYGACYGDLNSTWCEDSDGGFVVDVPGYIYGWNGSSNYTFEDTCVSNTSVTEYGCSSYGSYSITADCGNYGFDGCYEGACYKEVVNETFCEDTDGGIVVDVAGTVYGMNESGNYSYDDYCSSASWVVEYFCVEDQLSNMYQRCTLLGYDGCREGACYNETFSWTEVIAFPLNQSNSTNKTS